VDTEVPAVRAALNAQQGRLSPQSRSALKTVFTELGQLGKTRSAIDSGAMSPTAAFGVYDTIIDHLFVYFDTSVQDRGASLTGISVGASDSGYAFEMTTREIALVGGALLDHGQMSAAARTLFAGSVANRHLLLNEALALMTPSLNAGYIRLENSPAYRQFQTMESQILASPGRTVPVKAGDFQSASLAVLGAMEKTQIDSADQLTSISASRSDQLVTEAALAGGLGLAAVAASVFLLVWFGRKVTRDLGGLNDSVRGMADERLPRVVDRLRRGDDVDVAAESPPPATSTIQEISRIAESFDTVQGAAVSAAVDQARLRRGVNEVFLNISMRNQSLLHRQLGMLDSMERRTSEPGALADLFRLDHLTTRMRRYAEGLIILSGAVPGRGWRDPVPVVDILRAAVAEVEEYVRVDVTSESDDLVAGNAVSDVIHLIAELIENAAAFSPPNTRIEVRAERVGTGLVAEVEDRGLGMSPDELDDINARLASLPEFDLAHSDQLGLFVVSRLAARHAIKVSLRRSVYGGTMAVVLMPFGVVVRQEEVSQRPPWAGQPAESGPRTLTGRHRLPPPAVLAGTAGPTGSAGPDPGPGPGPGLGPGARNGEAEWPMAPWETGPITTPVEAATAGPAPALFSRPAPPTPSALPAPTVPPSGSHLGMPIRVPQTNMAPQLRAQRDADPQEPQDPPEDEPWFGARSPEATRSMLTMMQQGWRRGRMDDLDDPEGVPGTGTD
jgi:signal transduction histidine kinase